MTILDRSFSSDTPVVVTLTPRTEPLVLTRFFCEINQASGKPHRKLVNERSWFGTVLETDHVRAESKFLHTVCTRSKGMRSGDRGPGCTAEPGRPRHNSGKYNEIINYGRYLERAASGAEFQDFSCFETLRKALYKDTYAPE